MNRNRWFNFISDNGIPLPLVRHRGRGDLLATGVVLLLLAVLVVLMFGGTTIAIGGSTIRVPEINSIARALATLVPLVSMILGYIYKRRVDREVDADLQIAGALEPGPEPALEPLPTGGVALPSPDPCADLDGTPGGC